MAISPRNDLKVYRSCPEIRSHIRRVYGWAAIRGIISIPFNITLIPLAIMIFMAALLHRMAEALYRLVDIMGIRVATLGDKMAARIYRLEKAALNEAHEVLPLEEIQERTPDLYLPRGRVSDPSGDAILASMKTESENSNGNLGS